MDTPTSWDKDVRNRVKKEKWYEDGSFDGVPRCFSEVKKEVEERPSVETNDNVIEIPAEVKQEIDEDIFRCETQIIKTYTRQERKDPVNSQVTNVTHAFSFCNHADLPDDALINLIKGSWKDLFCLTGTKDISMAAEIDEINIVQDSVPDIDNCFPPKSETEEKCRFCDCEGLQKLTKCYLKRELEKDMDIE